MPSGRRNGATRTMKSRTMPCNVSTCSLNTVDQKGFCFNKASLLVWNRRLVYPAQGPAHLQHRQATPGPWGATCTRTRPILSSRHPVVRVIYNTHRGQKCFHKGNYPAPREGSTSHLSDPRTEAYAPTAGALETTLHTHQAGSKQQPPRHFSPGDTHNGSALAI